MTVSGADTARLPAEACETAPLVALAPLAGITDLPFRQIAARFGADFVVSEMIASHDMVQARPGTRDKALVGAAKGVPTAVQLAGREAHWMAEAARIAEDQGARLIDINMGCPAKKVTKGYSGSALMQDLDHALSLIEAVVGATTLPVTLKTRLGWSSDHRNAPDLARRAEGAGVQRLVIHGRTRCQFYKGQADWAAIAAVRAAVRIPVLANGDIQGPDSAQTALAASGAAGVMVGRGARGRPWVLGQIKAHLRGLPVPDAPKPMDVYDLIAEHYAQMLSLYGKDLGVRVARKQLGWYLDQLPAVSPGLRHNIMTGTDPVQVLQDVRRAFSDAPALDLGQAA